MSDQHHQRQSSSGISIYPKIIQTCLQTPHEDEHLRNKTLILDVEGGLLRSPSTFPYFMLVAIEAGSFLRGLILLCFYPLLCCLPQEVESKIMVMVCFMGLREEKVAKVARATLPKYFLEDVGREGLEVLRGVKRVVAICRLIPRVMVEPFLKEYMGLEVVVGREVKMIRGYYVGLLEKESEARLGQAKLDQTEMIGFGSSSSYFGYDHHQLFSWCKVVVEGYDTLKWTKENILNLNRKRLQILHAWLVHNNFAINLHVKASSSQDDEVYLVTPEEKRKWSPLPRDQYPRPLIFHDGRLAFRPTPQATLAMFMWLPLALPLTLLRTLIFLNLPYPISVAIGSVIGVTTRVINSPVPTGQVGSEPHAQPSPQGHLYVCNHRTLLDPVYISAMLNKQVSAVTYSVSRVSELLSPIRTVRLTRNRDEDRRRMEQSLKQGGLVVCPEGTTCREPYLLRFSHLFVELVDAVYPVALVNWSSMFHGTSTGRSKYLDHFYYFMNPRPAYDVQFMDKMPTRMVIDGKICESYEVANLVQGEIGKTLGFQSTKLTRKDKYLKLAGNEGIADTKE